MSSASSPRTSPGTASAAGSRSSSDCFTPEPIVRRIIPGADRGWVASGVDEFLRCYLTPRGRTAFYEAARNIYLDEPDGDDGFWNRLGGLECDTMFVWGRNDTLVPIAFMRHVERALP